MSMERKPIEDAKTSNCSRRMEEIWLKMENKKSLVNKPLTMQSKVKEDTKESISANQMKL